MIKPLNAFLFILTSSLLFCECGNDKITEVRTLSIDSLTYSAFRWRIRDNSDTSQLFIAYFISIDKNGKYFVMRHNITTEPAQYFIGNLNPSLMDSIDIVLSKKWDTTYFNPEPRIYDGNTYHLGFTKKMQRTNVIFIQEDSPLSLQLFTHILDSLVLNINTPTDSFGVENYQNYLKEKSLDLIGGLPKIEPPTIKIKRNSR